MRYKYLEFDAMYKALKKCCKSYRSDKKNARGITTGLFIQKKELFLRKYTKFTEYKLKKEGKIAAE